jgi:hypothetical protein
MQQAQINNTLNNEAQKQQHYEQARRRNASQTKASCRSLFSKTLPVHFQLLFATKTHTPLYIGECLAVKFYAVCLLRVAQNQTKNNGVTSLVHCRKSVMEKMQKIFFRFLSSKKGCFHPGS